MSSNFSGGCCCGAVRYKSSVEPVMQGNCHCTMCRKLSGTAHASMFAMPKQAIEIEGDLKFYEFTADSGNTVKRGFCTTCGSPVYNENEGMPELCMIHANSLDDPELFRPNVVVFSESAVSWDPIDASLPSFPGMPPMPV